MESRNSPTVAGTKFLGITSPISLNEPREIDVTLSKKLEEAMTPHGVFESQIELAKR